MQPMNNEELEKNMFDSILDDLIKGKESIKENFMIKINKILDG